MKKYLYFLTMNLVLASDNLLESSRKFYIEGNFKELNRICCDEILLEMGQDIVDFFYQLSFETNPISYENLKKVGLQYESFIREFVKWPITSKEYFEKLNITSCLDHDLKVNWPLLK